MAGFDMKNFFLSLKTTVWTLLSLVCVFFIGSYLMPVHREIHAGMNNRLLFDWAVETASGELWATWWFFASFAGLVLLTVNTIVCSIQAVKGRWSREDFLLRISPQIMHIGFLLILFAHLLGASAGYRLSGMVPEGARVKLPEGIILDLQALRVYPDRFGYIQDWRADVVLEKNGREAASGFLAPNKPLFYQGAGIYLKSFSFDPSPMAFIMVNKDPGAVWALAGAALFMTGSATLLVLKWKKA